MLELKIDAARVNDDDGSRSVENVSISELEPLATMTELLARADLDTSMEVENVVVGIVGEVNETQAAVLESKTGNMLIADEAGPRSVELAARLQPSFLVARDFALDSASKIAASKTRVMIDECVDGKIIVRKNLEVRDFGTGRIRIPHIFTCLHPC